MTCTFCGKKGEGDPRFPGPPRKCYTSRAKNECPHWLSACAAVESHDSLVKKLGPPPTSLITCAVCHAEVDESVLACFNPNCPIGGGKEAIHHPAHYGGDTPYEVIKMLRAWLTPEEYVGGLKFNIIKYNARARHKGGAEDYAKALWYSEELVRFTRKQIK